jgi:hypothetical protein
MFFLKLTLYTCAFYVAISAPIIIAELILEFAGSGFGIHFHRRLGIPAFAACWGLVWLLSFALAFRATFRPLWDRMLN